MDVSVYTATIATAAALVCKLSKIGNDGILKCMRFISEYRTMTHKSKRLFMAQLLRLPCKRPQFQITWYTLYNVQLLYPANYFKWFALFLHTNDIAFICTFLWQPKHEHCTL